MEKISFLTLRRQMPRVRERLKAGESFVLTDRGKVIAVLQPVTVDADEANTKVFGGFTVVEVGRTSPLDAVSPQAQPPGTVGKATPIKTRQQVADEILRGVRTGRRE